MKVLIKNDVDADNVRGSDLIMVDDGCLRYADGSGTTTDGTVADLTPKSVKEVLRMVAVRRFGSPMDRVDVWMKDLRKLSTALADWQTGDHVEVEATEDGLRVPVNPNVDRGWPLTEGCEAAFNETVSPAYLMNTRVTILEVDGDHVHYAAHEGDVARLERKGRTLTPIGRADARVFDRA
jgi:hypothetical protein